jgi:hypothetical protein
MNTPGTETVNTAIIDNGRYDHDWRFSALAGELYWWVAFFNIIFFTNQPVPVPVIAFKKNRITTRGHYRSKHNGFGIKDTLVLNRNHLDQPLWVTLATVLHELTHAWQAQCGTPSNSWFHNQEFRQKLAHCGITCDTKGHHTHLDDPFVFLLQKHGISFSGRNDAQPRMTPMPRRRGQSKLKKWSCGCTNVRVAVRDFKAQCLKCNNRFKRIT